MGTPVALANRLACTRVGRNFSLAHTYIVCRDTPSFFALSVREVPGTLARMSRMGYVALWMTMRRSRCSGGGSPAERALSVVMRSAFVSIVHTLHHIKRLTLPCKLCHTIYQSW